MLQLVNNAEQKLPLENKIKQVLDKLEIKFQTKMS